jgi:hypothetical protein
MTSDGARILRQHIYGYPKQRTLFIPDAYMMAMHAASLPSAVCKRAGVDLNYYYSDLAKLSHYGDWLRRWLYWLEKSPANVAIVRARNSLHIKNHAASRRPLPSWMFDFRKHSNVPGLVITLLPLINGFRNISLQGQTRRSLFTS